jgi:hypothetical protein
MTRLQTLNEATKDSHNYQTRILQQISKLMARVEKVETKETTTTTTATDDAPAIPISTPVTNTNYTFEPKGLKDPNAFNSTRSQYLL